MLQSWLACSYPQEGFRVIRQGANRIVEAPQESKRPHMEVIRPHQPKSPPVTKLLMAPVQDRDVFVPQLTEYTVLSVWRVFVEELILGVPSPLAYMRSMWRRRRSWMKHLNANRLKERGRAFHRVWANVVRLTRTGLGAEAACGQL